MVPILSTQGPAKSEATTVVAANATKQVAIHSRDQDLTSAT